MTSLSQNLLEDNKERPLISQKNDDSTKNIDKQPNVQQYQVYPARFLVVGLFSLIQMMTSILLNTLTPIAAYLTIIYNEQAVVINLASLLFALMHPIFTFPAAYVIDTYGARIGITIGCVLGIIGVSLRMLVNSSFAWVIVGQVIAGIGRPFILNCQAKISENWFTSQIRGGITQLLTLILNISLILGILVPSFVFSGYSPQQNNQQSIERGKQLTYKLMMIQTIMGAVCFGLNIIFMQNKPPTPPSASGTMPRDPFTVAMPKLFCNLNYVLLLLAFGCYFGIFNAISIILSYLLAPWFSERGNLPMAVAAVGGSPIISGIIGVAIIGQFQRKSKTYKKWILICMTGSSVAIVLFYPLLQTYSIWLTSFISMFNSFFLIPLVPIMIELGCQLAFPVGAGSAAGLLFAIGNLAGFLLGLILSAIVKGQTKGQSAWGLGFCLGIFIIGFILVMFMQQQKNRQKAQSQHDSKNRSSSSQNSNEGNSNNTEYSNNSEAKRQSLLSVQNSVYPINQDSINKKDKLSNESL